ncbi:MAG: hypothetical protein QXT93_13065 [Thermofilum sp.]
MVFTGEEFSECLPLSCKYYFERLREEVARGDFQLGENAASVFALTPIFFEGLEGRFREGSVVIVASCYGLTGRLLANALLSKGATYFISWDWKVSPEHMDEGLEELVEEAVAKRVGWVKAVENVNNRLGPDPLGGGRLRLVSASGQQRVAVFYQALPMPPNVELRCNGCDGEPRRLNEPEFGISSFGALATPSFCFAPLLPLRGGGSQVWV